MFRVCEDAELIYPHVLWLDEPMRAMPESARRKAFQETMENLERRRFYFRARGFPALPATSLQVDDFARSAGVASDDELYDPVFRMVPSKKYGCLD